MERACFIGRYSPPHNGHVALWKSVNKPVLILVRDTDYDSISGFIRTQLIYKIFNDEEIIMYRASSVQLQEQLDKLTLEYKEFNPNNPELRKIAQSRQLEILDLTADEMARVEEAEEAAQREEETS